MQVKSLIPAVLLALTLPMAVAQETNPGAKQDMKNAGSDTRNATTNAGHGISNGAKTGYHKSVNGTKKGYHKTVSGTKKGYHSTAHATRTGVNKVEGKPNTPADNPQR